MVDISLVRKLAKTQRYQDLYILSKELHMKFFDNETHITDIQLMFLKYVSFYYSINMDISLGEVNECVLEDEIFEDSYSYYKNRKDKKSYKPNNQQNSKENISSTNKWLFKSPRK